MQTDITQILFSYDCFGNAIKRLASSVICLYLGNIFLNTHFIVYVTRRQVKHGNDKWKTSSITHYSNPLKMPDLANNFFNLLNAKFCHFVGEPIINEQCCSDRGSELNEQ